MQGKEEQPVQHLFQPKLTWNINGSLISFDEPKVMGIINLTPDSFYSKSRHTTKSATKQAEKMLEDGAFMLDIGAASSRPGAAQLSAKEECDRLLPALDDIRKAFPNSIISVDTWQAEVAKAAVDHGANCINDISAGEMDEKMIETVASLRVPYIAMHMQGRPENMQDAPQYEDIMHEVLLFFAAKTQSFKAHGIVDFAIDPGFGFGKTLSHNYELLKHLSLFQQLECPILVGVSRKSMINKVLQTKAEEALNGSTVLHTLALLNGAHLLRVHDVKEAVEAMKLVQQYQKT